MFTNWGKVTGLLVLGMALCLNTGSARGQLDPLQEILRRLEKLEKENAELKQQLVGPPKGQKAADDLKTKEDKKTSDEKKADEGYEVGKQLDFKGKWNNGLWFETEDKAFRIHVGGRTQIDSVWVHAPKNVIGPVGGVIPGELIATPGIGEFDDAINFRRARLAVEGTFWEVFDFNCEYDFVNSARITPTGNVLNGRTVGGVQVNPQTLNNLIGTVPDRLNVINTPVPTDLWFQWSKIPYIGNIRIGNQKPWISFEHLTSSRFLDFMERSVAFDTFVENGNNGFIPGISVWNTYVEDRLLLAAGWYRPNFRDIFGFNVGDGENLYVTRIAGTPVYQENGRCMVHLGMAYQHATADDGVLRFRGRTQLRNGPAALHNTIAIIQAQAHDYNLFVPEVAMNYGPLNFSAEYYAAFCNMRPGEAFQNVANQTVNLPTGGRGSLFYQGAYATVGYFLTGEHRAYDMKRKAWDRQPVNESAFCVDADEGCCFGRGAVEVLARFSWLDLDAKGVNGGKIRSVTAGLNWFLNPSAKVQLNYEIGYRDVTQYNGNAIAFTPGLPQTFGAKAYDGIYQEFGTRFAFDF